MSCFANKMHTSVREFCAINVTYFKKNFSLIDKFKFWNEHKWQGNGVIIAFLSIKTPHDAIPVGCIECVRSKVLKYTASGLQRLKIA